MALVKDLVFVTESANTVATLPRETVVTDGWYSSARTIFDARVR